MNMPNVICFDLEGPLSPQDNAYEVMGLFKNGLRIFETISKYDDLLALEGRKGYEAGDTLSLIAPFLVYHGISEDNITMMSKKAMLVDGADKLIEELSKDSDAYIISTSYEQHAYNIGKQLGVPQENITCTTFPLDRYRKEFESEDTTLIAEAEKGIMEMYPPINDLKLKMRLDKFFFRDLPENPLGRIMRDMTVVGGERKVTAAQRIADAHGLGLKDIVVVGDSITDFKMLAAVNEKGGLAIAFNGNKYAIPHATIAIATTNMMDLLVILEQWKQGGREGVISTLAQRKDRKEPYIHVLVDMEDFSDVISIHKKTRNLVRGRAARLG